MGNDDVKLSLSDILLKSENWAHTAIVTFITQTIHKRIVASENIENLGRIAAGCCFLCYKVSLSKEALDCLAFGFVQKEEFE